MMDVGADDHVEGPEDARVTLVEYGDFECPNCGRMHPVLKKLRSEMSGEFRFVFRHFPLTNIHPNAQLAAEASEAAAAQGKFWEMHHAIFENQKNLSRKKLNQLARQLGLDADRFSVELESGTYKDRVKRDFLGGARGGVNQTPTFYINGVRYDGETDEASLRKAIIDAR